VFGLECGEDELLRAEACFGRGKVAMFETNKVVHIDSPQSEMDVKGIAVKVYRVIWEKLLCYFMEGCGMLRHPAPTSLLGNLYLSNGSRTAHLNYTLTISSQSLQPTPVPIVPSPPRVSLTA
jgi:hypothetical protein